MSPNLSAPPPLLSNILNQKPEAVLVRVSILAEKDLSLGPSSLLFELTDPKSLRLDMDMEPTDTSKLPVRTRYLGHVTGYQPIRDQYFGRFLHVPPVHRRKRPNRSLFPVYICNKNYLHYVSIMLYFPANVADIRSGMFQTFINYNVKLFIEATDERSGCRARRCRENVLPTMDVSKLMGLCWLCPSCFESVDTGKVKGSELAGASGDEIAAPISMDEQLQAFKSDILETMNCTMKAFMDKFDKSPVTTCATPKPANSHSPYAAALAKPKTTAKLTVSGNSDVLQSTNSLLTKTPTTYRKTNTNGSVVYGFKTAADLTRATEKINSANTGVKLEEYVSKPLLTMRNAEVSFIPSDVVDKKITDELIIDSIKVLNSDIAEALDKSETMEVIFFQRHRQRPDLATVGLRLKGHSSAECASHDHYGRDCDKKAREFRKCSNCAESSNPLFKSGVSDGLLNCFSLRNKTLDVLEMALDNSIDVLNLTETWMRKEDLAICSEIREVSFNVLHTPRGSRGGGVATLTKRNISMRKVNVQRKFRSFECQEVLLKPPANCRILVVYRPGTAGKKRRG
eukprot:sb/3463467/